MMKAWSLVIPSQWLFLISLKSVFLYTSSSQKPCFTTQKAVSTVMSSFNTFQAAIRFYSSLWKWLTDRVLTGMFWLFQLFWLSHRVYYAGKCISSSCQLFDWGILVSLFRNLVKFSDRFTFKLGTACSAFLNTSYWTQSLHLLVLITGDFCYTSQYCFICNGMVGQQGF